MKSVLLALMVLTMVAATACADCRVIEYAELKEMSLEELLGASRRVDDEYMLILESNRMNERTHNRLTVCNEQTTRILQMRVKNFPDYNTEKK